MTQSTSSANATGLPDRRHFLSTLSAASALGLATTPTAFAASPGPIEAMWPKHLRLEAEYDAIGMRLGDAEELYEQPERPRWHPFSEEGGYVTIRTGPGRGTCVLDHGKENVAYLKDAIAREYEPDAEDSGCRNKVRARRARKTLAKIEAWEAEARRRKHAAGLIEAQDAYDAAGVEADAQRAAILAIEASTYRELAFQAAVLDVDWDERAAHRILERLIALAGVEPYRSA